eukprot:scaffold132867_cov22-Tisochrysis_lutea.AAC.1
MSNLGRKGDLLGSTFYAASQKHERCQTQAGTHVLFSVAQRSSSCLNIYNLCVMLSIKSTVPPSSLSCCSTFTFAAF